MLTTSPYLRYRANYSTDMGPLQMAGLPRLPTSPTAPPTSGGGPSTGAGGMTAGGDGTPKSGTDPGGTLTPPVTKPPVPTPTGPTNISMSGSMANSNPNAAYVLMTGQLPPGWNGPDYSQMTMKQIAKGWGDTNMHAPAGVLPNMLELLTRMTLASDAPQPRHGDHAPMNNSSGTPTGLAGGGLAGAGNPLQTAAAPAGGPVGAPSRVGSVYDTGNQNYGGGPSMSGGYDVGRNGTRAMNGPLGGGPSSGSWDVGRNGTSANNYGPPSSGNTGIMPPGGHGSPPPGPGYPPPPPGGPLPPVYDGIGGINDPHPVPMTPPGGAGGGTRPQPGGFGGFGNGQFGNGQFGNGQYIQNMMQRFGNGQMGQIGQFGQQFRDWFADRPQWQQGQDPMAYRQQMQDWRQDRPQVNWQGMFGGSGSAPGGPAVGPNAGNRNVTPPPPAMGNMNR